MTAVVEEKTAIEFKGRMLMMTVLQLKNLDANMPPAGEPTSG